MRKLIKEAINERIISMMKKRFVGKEYVHKDYSGRELKIVIGDVESTPYVDDDGNPTDALRLWLRMYINGKVLTADWWESGYSTTFVANVWDDVAGIARRYLGVKEMVINQLRK